jgi:hypothetical protein
VETVQFAASLKAGIAVCFFHHEGHEGRLGGHRFVDVAGVGVDGKRRPLDLPGSDEALPSMGFFCCRRRVGLRQSRAMKTTRLILLAALTCVSTALAVDPPPDGGYPNQNTAEGEDALLNLDLGSPGRNTAVGFQTLYHNTTGYDNAAVGNMALTSNTTGGSNSALGSYALQNNTTGGANTASGFIALRLNTTGSGNTATGTSALLYNNGDENTATGASALQNNSSGNYNTASGCLALAINITGNFNTASGTQALHGNAIGNENTGTGFNALFYNYADYNTADGSSALYNTQTGASNTAVGHLSLFSNYSGSRNIALGNSAGLNISGNDNIDIGNQGVAGESGVIRLGTEATQTAVFIAGVRTSGLAVATGVGITTDGQLGVRASSARFKEAIKPMDKASEVILSLQPVTFRYKKQLDPKATPQFGLVAEDVAKVDSDLVVRDAAGKPLTVRYDEVNAMLLNEFLKEYRKVEELETTVARLQSTIEKVSARVEAEHSAPRLVTTGD